MPFPSEVSAAGIDLIKQCEGLRLTAYKDPAGILSIAYGHTGRDVQPGQRITEAQAEEMLERDLDYMIPIVKRSLAREPTQAQFDAMMCLTYNIGPEAFRNSTVCRRFNEGNEIAAADAFGLFRKITIGGKKVDSAGLVKRRALEKALFLSGTETPAQPAIAEEAPISASGTIHGGTVAAGASALAGVAGLVNEFQQTMMNLPLWVGDVSRFIVGQYPRIAIGLAAVAALAGIYVIARRFANRSEGHI